MSDDTGRCWVVKFQNNPQHRRVLINEFIAARLGRLLGLTISPCARIGVGPAVAAQIERELGLPQGDGRYSAGIHFGSLYAGGLLPGMVVSLACANLSEISNGAELAGIYVLDVWLHNRDQRQVVFTRSARQRRRHAVWIDQGYCLGGPHWTLDGPGRRDRYKQLATLLCPDIHLRVSQWVRRVQNLPLLAFYKILSELPQTWCTGDEQALVELMEQLFCRQRELDRLVRSALSMDFDDRLAP